jgi:glycosyltransferase involved in cell wall biosynthesis
VNTKTNLLAIGIPTFNRKEYVKFCAESLSKAKDINCCSIIVFDDNSTDFDVDYLKKIFPPGTEIIRKNEKSAGADYVTRDLMVELTRRNFTRFLILDSDFILVSNFIKLALEQFHKSEGLLSLFNSYKHEEYEHHDSNLCCKRIVGAAATMWSLELAVEVLHNVPSGRAFDIRFSNYLTSKNKKIFVTTNSLAQHLGYANGQNSVPGRGDIGKGFRDTDLNNLYLLAESTMIENQRLLGATSLKVDMLIKYYSGGGLKYFPAFCSKILGILLLYFGELFSKQSVINLADRCKNYYKAKKFLSKIK